MEDYLSSILNDYDRIIIDTCSILHEHADVFWSNIVPLIRGQWKTVENDADRKTVLIPMSVFREVEKFANSPSLCAKKNTPDLNDRALKARATIIKLQNEGIITLFTDPPGDIHADKTILTTVTAFRTKYNLVIITQDNNLAGDVKKLENTQSVLTKKQTWVLRLNKRDGSLGEFRPRPPLEECFGLASTVSDVTGSLTISSFPSEGSDLIARRGDNTKTVTLDKKIASGGEGIIYSVNIPGKVAKIYKSGKIDQAKLVKLRLMMTKSINCEGVCFPEELLYNQKGEFVGYLMKQANGSELQRSLFIPPLFKEKFPNWTKVDTVTLCITILEKLKYLHDRNVILGDINPNNILVVSPTEVYFVDTDSYQVEGFPCPVGTINYTAPEIQGKEYSSFLRTKGNEYFAVATLLFMIMLPGKSPYSLQGGENQIDNIKNGDFAYPCGELSTGKVPEGPWRYCWSHLPRFLKNSFYKTFRKGEEFSAENNRRPVGYWLQEFNHYRELLNNGSLEKQDSMSLDIFPTRLKKNPNANYIYCKICNREVDEERTKEGICKDCLKKTETYQCANCGRDVEFTYYQRFVKNFEYCEDCKDETFVKNTCVECGKRFVITYGEKSFYCRNGLELPKKCQSCRK